MQCLRATDCLTHEAPGLKGEHKEWGLPSRLERSTDPEALGEGHTSVSLDSRGKPRMVLFGEKWEGNGRGNRKCGVSRLLSLDTDP